MPFIFLGKLNIKSLVMHIAVNLYNMIMYRLAWVVCWPLGQFMYVFPNLVYSSIQIAVLKVSCACCKNIIFSSQIILTSVKSGMLLYCVSFKAVSTTETCIDQLTRYLYVPFAIVCIPYTITKKYA